MDIDYECAYVHNSPCMETQTNIVVEPAGDAGTRGRVRRSTAIDSKWGGAILGGLNGYQLVPDVLLRKQVDLKLDTTDVVILLNICMHWWESEPDNLPHPRPVTIAKRMGVSTRTVERHIARLSSLGILEWKPPEARPDSPSIRRFDLEGLRGLLEQLAENSGQDGGD